MIQVSEETERKIVGEDFVHEIIEAIDFDPSMLALDIGANHGHYSRILSKKGATVFAFEPYSQNFETMKKNCEGYQNIYFENMAAGSVTGHMPLYLCPKNYGAHTLSEEHLGKTWGHTKENYETVRVIKLDDYFQGRTDIAFMKIDVEGLEEQVLRGAEGILRNNIIIMALETHQTIDCKSLYRYLTSLGYGVYVKAFDAYDNEFSPKVQEMHPDVHYLITNMKVTND